MSSIEFTRPTLILSSFLSHSSILYACFLSPFFHLTYLLLSPAMPWLHLSFDQRSSHHIGMRRRREFTRNGTTPPSTGSHLPDYVAASMIAREGHSRFGHRLYGTGSAPFAGSTQSFAGYSNGSAMGSPMLSRRPSTTSLASSCHYCTCDGRIL